MSRLWIKLAVALSGVALLANCSDDNKVRDNDENTDETGGSGGKAGGSAGSNVGKNNAGNAGQGGKSGTAGSSGSSTAGKSGGNGDAGNAAGNAQAGGGGKAGDSSGSAGSAGSGKGGAAGAAGNKGTGGSSGKGAGGSTGTGGKSGAGGSSGSASTGTGGGSTGTGGSTNSGSDVPGYWTSKEWHGCSWTGVGTNGASTITPKDFTATKTGGPYCAKGSVGKDEEYRGVALVGFNIKEDNPDSCEYKPVDTTASGPPSVDKMGGSGIAINLVKQGSDTSFTFRVQIQGPDGAKEGTVGENDRWCANITAIQGKIFVPYTDFYTKCWETDTSKKGNKYNGEDIDAVVFTVPGDNAKDIPFEFCINGLAYGETAADAPDGTAVAGDQTGTVGGAGEDKDFDRAKVLVDGEEYIIQNNNWGNPDGTDLTLSFKNNSFKITSGSGSGGDAPASFPSIYIGANGNTQNGVYATSGTDNLPILVSNIKSAVSTFRYSGSTSVYNATYDIWFAKSKPTAEYQDGIDGFVMIWLRDPSGKQPIGSQKATSVDVAGQKWNVWEGPRGNGPSGQYNNAPVVSFVNTSEDNDSRAQSFKDVDILQFLTAAQTYGLPSGLYLTDVFAGFEIWNGGSGGNLSVDEFKCIVTPK